VQKFAYADFLKTLTMYSRGKNTNIANIAWPHRLVYTEQSSDALTTLSSNGASKHLSLYTGGHAHHSDVSSATLTIVACPGGYMQYLHYSQGSFCRNGGIFRSLNPELDGFAIPTVAERVT